MQVSIRIINDESVHENEAFTKRLAKLKGNHYNKR